ncbi:MAG TPA: hypothetical protein DHV83_05345 [Prevotella sp.]|nr:hypothetical protein [Prevotella sp.]
MAEEHLTTVDGGAFCRKMLGGERKGEEEHGEEESFTQEPLPQPLSIGGREPLPQPLSKGEGSDMLDTQFLSVHALFLLYIVFYRVYSFL